MKPALAVLLCSYLLTGCAAESPADNATSIVDDAVPEKRCGESRDAYFSAYTLEQLQAYADCTILVGHFQEDSVSELQDLAALKNVTKVEGNINIFRSPGFLTLHGLENLEVVDGNLYIHLNPNLESLRGLVKLQTVTGNMLIEYNDVVPSTDLEWLGNRVSVGGIKTIAP